MTKLKNYCNILVLGSMADIHHKSENTHSNVGYIQLGKTGSFEERIVNAFLNKKGFVGLSENERNTVVTRGMAIAVKLLNNDWYEPNKSWYVDNEHGIGQLINDVTSYYNCSRAHKTGGFLTFLQSATDEEFYAFLEEIPEQMRPVLIFHLYPESLRQSEEGHGRLERKWAPAIRQTLSDLKSNNHERFLEVMAAHDKIDQLCINLGHRHRVFTYVPLVPITFELVCESVKTHLPSETGNQDQGEVGISQVIEQAARFVLDDRNKEQVNRLIKQALHLENRAVVASVWRSS